MRDQIIGRVRFADGIERDVRLADDGRQYVLDAAGLPVIGEWILAEDVEPDPLIIVRGEV